VIKLATHEKYPEEFYYFPADAESMKRNVTIIAVGRED
jgi:hypothetical protein